MNKNLSFLVVAILLLIMNINGFAQTVSVDVNLNVKHTVGDISEFDRSKFVTIHSDIDDGEWASSFTANLRDHFLNGYDVYLGRNTGSITWNLNNTLQDPNRPGYADTVDVAAKGQNNRNSYAEKSYLHEYEHRNNQILCTQLHPFYPDGQQLNSGWAFSQDDTEDKPFGTASGEFYAHWTKNAYGTGGTTGQPKPKLLEVVNEPLWHLVDYGDHEPEEVFKFHNSVAQEVKKLNSDVEIGGFCTAFPDFEKNNFQQWEDRWKLFMDMSGEYMDFWTIHLYDFPSISNGKRKYRKGSNMEATFDMMEQYSYLKFGKVKPFMISEYGAQMHDYFGAWSPYRDWLHIISSNAMMMQFMERADIINQTINFIPIKAKWGTTDVDNTYNHRLMRRADEPASLSGTWVYSEMVKIYQLWANVKGTRVDSKQSNLDILTDAYVDGNKAYVILNSLAWKSQDIDVNLFGVEASNIESLMVKHVYLGETNSVKDANLPVLDTVNYTTLPEKLSLKPEATMVLEYTFASDIAMNETSVETKHYATEYYKEINAGSENQFSINGVGIGSCGEAILRLGLGRNHGKSLRPVVKVNGVDVYVPANFRGDEQKDRDTFFGVLEIEVPFELLQNDNEIVVQFEDAGGFISSVAMQVFNFSTDIARANGGAVSGVELTPETLNLAIGETFQLVEVVYPLNADDLRVSFTSSDQGIVQVSNTTGFIKAISSGEAHVVVTTVDGAFTDTTFVTVSDFQEGYLKVDDPNKYLTTQYQVGENIQVVTEFHAGTGQTVSDAYGGVQVLLRECTSAWAVVKDYTFDNSGVIGQQSGSATVTVDLANIPGVSELPAGNFYFLFPRFRASDGTDYVVNGLAPISIIGETSYNQTALQNLVIYPNPATNKLFISGIDNETLHVEIYTISGMKLKESTVLNKGNKTINVDGLSQGFYLLRIFNEAGQKVFSFQKE